MYLQHLPVIMSLLRADRRLRVGYVTSDLYAHPVSDDVTAVWQVCVCVYVCVRVRACVPSHTSRMKRVALSSSVLFFHFFCRCMTRVVSSASAYAYAT